MAIAGKQNSNNSLKEQDNNKAPEGPWKVLQKYWHGRKLSEGEMKKTMNNF